MKLSSITPSSSDRPVKILILEDEPLDLKLIERELQRLPYEVELRCVEERYEFLRELLDFVPDLVLSDFHLPGFSGMEALILVRETFTELPFIFLTGESNPRLQQQWQEQGVSAVLNKNELSDLGRIIEIGRNRHQANRSVLTEIRVKQQLRMQLRQVKEIEQQLAMMTDGHDQDTDQYFSEVRSTLEGIYRHLQVRKANALRRNG